MESTADKAMRYLADGRLSVRRVSGDEVYATCRGRDDTLYRLGRDTYSGWWCSCPARLTCVHIYAARQVTRGRPRPQPDDPTPARPFTLGTCSYREWTPSMGTPVRTSLGVPRWIKRDTPWPYLKEAAPRRDYFNAPEDEFNRRYLDQLDTFGVAMIAEKLTWIPADGGALILLCFEKLNTGKPCHRRLFAAWWKRHTGQDVPELGTCQERSHL